MFSRDRNGNRPWTKEEEGLIAQGFLLVSEHHRWGTAPCWKHPQTGEIRFVEFVALNGQRGEYRIFTPQQMYEYLEENWQPPSESDSLWKEYQMKSWFNLG